MYNDDYLLILIYTYTSILSRSKVLYDERSGVTAKSDISVYLVIYKRKPECHQRDVVV